MLGSIFGNCPFFVRRYAMWSLLAVVAVVVAYHTLLKIDHPLQSNNLSQSLYSLSEQAVMPPALNSAEQMLTHDQMFQILFNQYNSMSDPTVTRRYLQMIRSLMTRPDSTQPLRLQNNNKERIAHGGGQTKVIDERLFGRRNGFFVDSGAFDGDTYSNTLFLEMERNWTGLLIEPDPESYKQLLKKNRRAIVFNGCLSPSRRPRQMTFMASGMAGGLADRLPEKQLNRIKSSGKLFEVKCFPLDDILSALGVHHVDYLNLDVEGPEVEILSTINWNQTSIDIMSVEMQNYPEKTAAMRQLMSKIGLHREVKMVALDLVYESIRLDNTSAH